MELDARRVYVVEEELEDVALRRLQAHLMQFNQRYGRKWSLVLPKRGRLDGAVVGRCSDNNHLMYQVHLDQILLDCPRPLTKDGIRLVLVKFGEKPSTAKLLAPDYLKLITTVLDPRTKAHRMAARTLVEWGEP
jgi:hypothetical protein